MLARVPRALSLLALAHVLGGASCHPRIEAPPPVPPPEAAVELPLSRIDTFVRIPLDVIETQANAVVPRQFRVEPYRMVVDGTTDDPVVSAGYEMQRDRIGVAIENGTIMMRTTLAYWVRAQRHVGPLEVPGSCGLDGEPRRHFALAVALDARVDDAWNLAPSIGVRELTATDRCEMTFAGVDVTSRVRASLADELGRTLPELRASIRDSAGLRDQAARLWRRFAEPTALDDGAWLAMHPIAAGVTQPTIEGHYLRVGLSLTARPEVVVGARPETPPLPLPRATEVVGTPGLEMHVPVRIEHRVLEEALADALRLASGGVRYPATGRRYIRPTHATLYGYGRSVVVRVEFTGFADGVLYLSGTPTLDTDSEVLTIPDLDYTVETRSLLMRMASTLRADDVRSDLRERLRIDLRGPLEAMRLRLTNALRRREGPVEVSGAVDTLRILSLRADPEAQRVEATVRATGVVEAHYVGE